MHSSFSPTTSDMFSRFFKSKFYKKSKSYLDTVKAKVEIIQRKRNAVQKFVKNDIAEFLRLGLDYRAYQRAAGLLMEYNKSFCYELIEKYCGCVLNHLDDLSKKRDCPDECKEAVQTLIYAASRFGDLPELLEFRSLFTHKYGNSTFQPDLKHEFESKFRQDPPARETTIQLLHDIAAEFSLHWDSDSLIQEIYGPRSLCDQEGSKEEEKNNKGEEGRGKEVVSIYESGDEEDEESSSSTEMWSQDSKKTSSSSSLPSVSEDDDDDDKPQNQRPFSSGLVPAPYSLIPKNFNHNKVDGGNLQNQEKPKHKHKPEGISVRTTRSAAPARHVHPKLPEFDDLVTQLSSRRKSI